VQAGSHPEGYDINFARAINNLDGGKKVMVGGERIEFVEALFNPSLIFVDKVGGLHTLVANAILKVDQKHAHRGRYDE
jgi:hypothetical protein